jgi:hypothetical protein
VVPKPSQLEEKWHRAPHARSFLCANLAVIGRAASLNDSYYSFSSWTTYVGAVPVPGSTSAEMAFRVGPGITRTQYVLWRHELDGYRRFLVYNHLLGSGIIYQFLRRSQHLSHRFFSIFSFSHLVNYGSSRSYVCRSSMTALYHWYIC